MTSSSISIGALLFDVNSRRGYLDGTRELHACAWLGAPAVVA
jgi:hypothetical protein